MALAHALKLLKVRDRFDAEVKGALEEKGFDPDSVENAMRFLRERRIIDDERLTKSLIERASGKRSMGKEKIRAELLKRGAPEDTIERHLAAIQDEGEAQGIDELLKIKYRPTDNRAKAARFLYGRGYDEEQIESALERFFGSVSDD